MSTFSSLQEAVIELTGLKTSTSGVKGTLPFGLEMSHEATNPLEECEQ